jgi:hypothetical protein
MTSDRFEAMEEQFRYAHTSASTPLPASSTPSGLDSKHIASTIMPTQTRRAAADAGPKFFTGELSVTPTVHLPMTLIMQPSLLQQRRPLRVRPRLRCLVLKKWKCCMKYISRQTYSVRHGRNYLVFFSHLTSLTQTSCLT